MVRFTVYFLPRAGQCLLRILIVGGWCHLALIKALWAVGDDCLVVQKLDGGSGNEAKCVIAARQLEFHLITVFFFLRICHDQEIRSGRGQARTYHSKRYFVKQKLGSLWPILPSRQVMLYHLTGDISGCIVCVKI